MNSRRDKIGEDVTRFNGQVAIVTGGASGVGRATALRLSSEGASVAIFDIDREGSDYTAALAQREGASIAPLTVDVRDLNSIRENVEVVSERFGRPSVLVNCAGTGRFMHTLDVDLAQWDQIIGVNLTGTFLMCQAVLPFLLNGGGAIVNVASSAGIQGTPYNAAYAASKGGVVLLTKSLALEYVSAGVRINAVAPGGVQTPMLEQFTLPHGADPAFIGRGSRIPYALPEEVATLIAYLASDEARFVVGSITSIDGGGTA